MAPQKRKHTDSATASSEQENTRVCVIYFLNSKCENFPDISELKYM